MSPAMRIILLWLGFTGSHLTLSSLPVRRGLVARIGENAFRGLYSLVAFAFFIPLVWTYFALKHARSWLWTVPPRRAIRWTIYPGGGVGCLLRAVVRILQRSGFGGC